MKTIFLVDDSPTILLSMSTVLAKAGFEVGKAACAEDALAAVGAMSAAPALVITDYHMPGMNGVDLVKELRKLSKCRFMPVLLLTTEAQQSKRDEARAAGATGWLVKPVEPEQLLQVIGKVVPQAA